MVLTTQGLLVLVVLSAVIGKEEKIKHRAYFTDPGNTWQYLQHFAFDPFTPFPELSKNTPGPSTPTPVPTTPTSGPTTPAPLMPITEQKGLAVSAEHPVIGQENAEDGKKKCEEENNNKQLQISTREWVQSILRRTTRKPTTTTTTTTTTTKTTTTSTTTTTEVVLTRELQLQLQKLLARKNLQETSRSRSNSIPGNAINHEPRDIFFTRKPDFVEGQYSNSQLESAHPGPNFPQNLYFDSQQHPVINLYQQRQSLSNQKQDQSKFINQLQTLILERSTIGFPPSPNPQQLPRQTFEQRRKYLFP